MSRPWMLALRDRALPWLLVAAAAACGGDERKPEGEEHGEEAEHAEAPKDAVLLDSAALSLSDVRVGTAGVARSGGLTATGAITYDANRVSHVGPRTAGRVTRLAAEAGQAVRGGQLLALLESPEVGAVRADLREALALYRIARESYARERRLEAQGISSRKELLEFEAELRRTEASVQSARDKLRALGGTGGQGSQFALTAPFSGTVVARDANLGEMTDPADTLFTVADLSRLWIELDIFERDLGRVAPGQEASVAVAAYPGRTFPGRIVYLGDVLNPSTRTVRARVEVENPGRVLKPGMFATATIRTAVGAEVPTVPRDAVQEVDGRTVVWVPGGRPGEFRMRPVTVGEPLGDGTVVIRSGLQPGERVVIAGAFTLRSELSKGEIGEHGH